jgi:hypothetical protein
MAVVTTKSLSIVNADATPIVATSIGEGAPGFLKEVNDSITAVAADSIASIYRFVRIPTNAKVKRVLLSSVSITVAAADLDVAFSDSTTDGTQLAFSSLANPVVQVTGPVDNKLFGSAQTLAGPLTNVDKTFTGTFLFIHQNLPLWQVLVNLGCTQFTADPGGYFDIVAKLTAAVTVGGTASVEVDYVE